MKRRQVGEKRTKEIKHFCRGVNETEIKGENRKKRRKGKTRVYVNIMTIKIESYFYSINC